MAEAPIALQDGMILEHRMQKLRTGRRRLRRLLRDHGACPEKRRGEASDFVNVIIMLPAPLANIQGRGL
jgi:hypothetical protein